MPSETVAPPAVAECPVAPEGRVVDVVPSGRGEAGTLAVEVTVTRVRVHDDIRVPGSPHRVDPDRWRPLVMGFQRFYGLGGEVHPSRLAGIDEEWYGR